MPSVALIAGTGSRELLRGLVREDVRVNVEDTAVALARVRHPPYEFYYLHRHGPGHHVAPHLINHAVHFAALRILDVKWAVALCAVGSLRPDLEPGATVLLDDFIGARETPDHVHFSKSPRSIVHTDLTHPYCPVLRQQLRSALADHGSLADGGTYMGVAGPRYETPAEIASYARQGADVVGMTGAAEAVCAREAGICYAAIACVTNMGSGLAPQRIRHGAVASEMRAIVAALRTRFLHALRVISGLPVCQTCRPDRY